MRRFVGIGMMAGVGVLAAAAAFAGEGVRYRGIFVNDEDWGLRPWAVKHFGKAEQIGVRAYEEIFRIMKADGLNLLWPAMHEGGYEFSARPENFALADRFGITIGTSHCEPMLRNNCYLPKSDKKKWSWTANPEFLKDYWSEGVRRGDGHRVMYSLGMRGIHDGRMPDGRSTAEKKAILEEVFAAQMSLLSSAANLQGTTLFCLYKKAWNNGVRDVWMLNVGDVFQAELLLDGYGRRPTGRTFPNLSG